MADIRSSAPQQSATLPVNSLFASPNYNGKCMVQLYKFFKSGQLTDVTLIAGDEKIKTHRIVLCSNSKYFSAIFGSDILESRSGVITLNDIDVNVLKDLVQYCYTGRIDLHMNTVEKLLSTSSSLGFTEVVEATCNFLADHLQPENCIRIAMFAELHNCTGLKQAAMHYISENFFSVINCREFELLSKTDVIKFLLSDDLKVSSEISVFEAVMKWVNSGSTEENRTEHLSTLLQYVKQPLLKPESEQLRS